MKSLGTFDIWLYVWAVRRTGSVMAPVHDLPSLWVWWAKETTQANLTMRLGK
jgi:hypothetical protein